MNNKKSDYLNSLLLVDNDVKVKHLNKCFLMVENKYCIFYSKSQLE